MTLITNTVGQTYIKIPTNIKISTKFILSFEVVVISREAQKKFEKGAVIIPEVLSAFLQMSAVESSEVQVKFYKCAENT